MSTGHSGTWFSFVQIPISEGDGVGYIVLFGAPIEFGVILLINPLGGKLFRQLTFPLVNRNKVDV